MGSNPTSDISFFSCKIVCSWIFNHRVYEYIATVQYSIALPWIMHSFLDMMYSQTSFIRIPRHPEENHSLPIYSIWHAYIQYVCSIIRFPRLSGYFCGKRMCAVMRGLAVLSTLSCSIDSSSCICYQDPLTLISRALGDCLQPAQALCHYLTAQRLWILNSLLGVKHHADTCCIILFVCSGGVASDISFNFTKRKRWVSALAMIYLDSSCQCASY